MPIIKSILAALAVLFSIVMSTGQGFMEVGQDLGVSAGYFGGEYGGGVSFVDFNQDGLDDLTVATGIGENIRFYSNTGVGFELLSPLVDNTTEVKQVLWVDYDNDGDFDLYVTSANLNRLYKNIGNLSFQDITGTCGFSDPIDQSFCASWLDYDEDGLLDLCVSHRLSHLVGNLTLYHNLGNDQFEDVTAAAGLSGLGNSVLAMTTLDCNNDGLEDIYVGQDYDAGNLLLKNLGDGTFENISTTSGSDVLNDSMSTTVGDYNGDGYMDIYVTNTNPGNSLFENQGDETYVDQAIPMQVVLYAFTWSAVFLDADCDTDLDLHVNGTSNSGSSYMFQNPGDGSAFINSSLQWGFGADSDYSVGSAIGDYNGDGRPDIFRNGSSGDQSSLWENIALSNNYLNVNLVGTISNSQAVGAVVDVQVDGQHMIRRLGCGENFSSQNSNTQFFGLGSADFADLITVTWPSGLVSSIENVTANQLITIVETGCSIPGSCNYDPDSTGENDDLCTFPGCNDTGACNYDSDAGCDDGSCEYSCTGCTDPEAINYDSQATLDDGSCQYPCEEVELHITTDCWGGETSWELIDDESGNIIASVGINTYGALQEYIWSDCLEYGCYTLNLYDSFSDGLGGSTSGCDVDGEYYVYSQAIGDTIVTMPVANFGSMVTHSFCLPTIMGCVDSAACNYDTEATTDDGSCLYPGCTDSAAATYDPEAGCDDGSCLYGAPACTGDLNFDGEINVEDLLILLTAFGTLCN